MKLTEEQWKKVQEFWNTFDKKRSDEETSVPLSGSTCGPSSFVPPEKGNERQVCMELRPGLLKKMSLMEECLRIFRDKEVPKELRMLSLALVCLTLEEQAEGLRFFVEYALGTDSGNTGISREN